MCLRCNDLDPIGMILPIFFTSVKGFTTFMRAILLKSSYSRIYISKKEIKSLVKMFHLISYNYIYLLMLESTMGWNPSEEAIFFTIFSRSLKKTCHQRKLRQTKCLLLNFWVIKLTKTPILTNCQVPNGFLMYNCKFYHLKIEK